MIPAGIVKTLGDPDVEWVAHHVGVDQRAADAEHDEHVPVGWYVTGYQDGDRESPLVSLYVSWAVHADGAFVGTQFAGALRDVLNGVAEPDARPEVVVDDPDATEVRHYIGLMGAGTRVSWRLAGTRRSWAESAAPDPRTPLPGGTRCGRVYPVSAAVAEAFMADEPEDGGAVPTTEGETAG